MVQIECSICAKDMYAEAGLCDGVFYTLPRHLLREPPQLPCRCSRRPSYTKEQLDYRAKKVCEGLGYEFVEWVKEIRTSGKIRYRCKIHGIHSIRMKNMVNGTGCPECAGKNQKQCYINTVYDNRTAVAIKFGITKDSDKRVKHQNYRNLFQMEQSAVYEFKTVKACKDAEKACKGELKCGVLSKRELKDGHSETVSLLDLEKVIAIYERFGGVRVLTPAKE
ncbi:hypothetical protein [Acinetobacter phage ABPH49]|nr:hypothetical protein [Acinetobacter phage ABPH49]